MHKNYINDNNESNAGNNGNRGKFSERLNKICRDRLKLNKPVIEEEKEESVIKRGGRNVLKIVLAIPSVVYSVVKLDKSEEISKKTKGISSNGKKIGDVKSNVKGIINGKNVDMVSSEKELKNIKNVPVIENAQKKENRKIKVNKIREIDVSVLKKQKEMYLREKKNDIESENNNIYYSIGKYSGINAQGKKIEDRIRIEKLQKEIIDLIKKRLVENINELEILQSELYLLKEVNGEDKYLKDCQEDIKEIKKMLSKVKSLKEKYDYLKDNVDFEYMLEYGDDLLIDKILELKELCSHDDISHLVDDYKILEEYKYLYLKIDKLQEDSIAFEEHKREQAEELKKRDIDFEKLKMDAYDVDRDNSRYDRFVKEQERFLRDLESKVLNIDSHERVTYRLKGFSQLVGNSFKYMGLLLLNPLKGLIPGIATQTMVTKNVIHNLYDNLEWQENRKMVYEAIDYSTSITIAINNLDDTLSLVNSTLEDVIRLRTKYEKEFSKYQYSFPGYRDTIKKINKMENAIMGNKLKIELMQRRMKEKERQNSDKLKKVKKLNSSANN